MPRSFLVRLNLLQLYEPARVRENRAVGVSVLVMLVGAAAIAGYTYFFFSSFPKYSFLCLEDGKIPEPDQFYQASCECTRKDGGTVSGNERDFAQAFFTLPPTTYKPMDFWSAQFATKGQMLQSIQKNISDALARFSNTANRPGVSSTDLGSASTQVLRIVGDALQAVTGVLTADSFSASEFSRTQDITAPKSQWQSFSQAMPLCPGVHELTTVDFLPSQYEGMSPEALAASNETKNARTTLQLLFYLPGEISIKGCENNANVQSMTAQERDAWNTYMSLMCNPRVQDEVPLVGIEFYCSRYGVCTFTGEYVIVTGYARAPTGASILGQKMRLDQIRTFKDEVVTRPPVRCCGFKVASPLDHLLQLLSGLGGLIPGVVTGFAIAFAWWVRDGHGAAGHGQIMPQASMAPGMDQQPSWKEAPAEKGPTDTKWAEHTPPGTGKPQPQPAIGQPVLMDA